MHGGPHVMSDQLAGGDEHVERARDLIAIEHPVHPGRRLRLDELLRSLGASDGGAPAQRPEHLSVGELVDKANEGGFGFLVGILTLIAIPFFGLSTPFGLAIALIGIQMVLGRHTPWLPRRARRRELRMHMLDRVLGILARRTRWLARWTRRRAEVVISTRLIGLGVLLLALGLALPLPVPGSNMIFLIPLFIYAVGLLERDGVWIAVGHACTLINMALLVAFSATVVMVFEKIAGWF